MPDEPTPLKKTISPQDDAQLSKPIERIVCSGGGAKGAMYPGAYKALDDTGILKTVTHFSGTSAGAITATLMALGISPEVLREQLLKTNFKQLLGKNIGNAIGKNPAGVSFITKDGKPLYEYIRSSIIETIKSTLESERCPDDKEMIALWNSLKKWDKSKEPYPKITFFHLARLCEYFPNKFKQVNLSAIQFPRGDVHIFNSDLTPNVEIALACRASASIPVLLEPVLIDGQLYMDGGLFDNVPTEFFDRDEQGRWIENQKPIHTMVFAFGEGKNDKKNPVFQALYGTRQDEIYEELIEQLFNEDSNQTHTLSQSTADWTLEKETNEMVQSAKTNIEYWTNDSNIKKDIVKVMEQAQQQILSQKKQIETLIKRNAWPKTQRLPVLSFFKELLKPRLYQANFFERLKRNIFVRQFSGLNAPYENTEQKELSYQRLRTRYPLRTVELRVGSIKTTDFDKATENARVLNSFGYLDTLNFICNHELENKEQFNADDFYRNLVKNFTHIYMATLVGSGSDVKNDALLKSIMPTDNKSISTRHAYELIKEAAERNMDSKAAFSLSRTIEFQNMHISSEVLFKDIYEESFRRSSYFSVSRITNTWIFNSTVLHQKLQNQNMFKLYNQQAKNEGSPTRTTKIYEELSKLQNFQVEPDSPIIRPCN